MQASSASAPAPTVELQGSVALVTGAAGGIGRACVEILAAAGARVVAVDREPGASSPMPATASADAGAVEPRRCDVTDEVAVEALFAEVARTYGRLDILVNCAGVLEKIARTIDQDLADWERVLSVNLKGVFLCCRAAGRIMVPQRGGAVVNIGSVAGLVGVPGSNAYGPGKAAVAHLTRNLGCEWARFGIRVNCVAPGYIDAPMSHQLMAPGSLALDAAMRRVPMGRMGSAAEVAAAVLFLCSPLASYITGSVLCVDGGWSAFGGPSR